MNIETIRRVCLARHLFELAMNSVRSKNDLHLFSAVNLAHDAIETFLIAVGDRVGATFPKHTDFDKYFVLINEKISPNALPSKTGLIRLNLVRVNSKHHGIQPAREECERLLAGAREFMDEVSLTHFGASFSTISTIDLLADGECKNHLVAARSALQQGDYETCVVLCRKAVYVEIERYYDVSLYREGEPKGILSIVLCKAPYYARNCDYIDRNVNDPTDYIVLDHASVDRDLLISGVDPTDFWNVLRLTPQVFKDERGSWCVKRDFSKVDPVTLAENAEYVFSTTLDIALAKHASRRAVRWQGSGRFFLKLARRNVPVYSKADRTSRVQATTPDNLDCIDTDYTVEGLDGAGTYWHVSHRDHKPWFSGFVHNDDVISE